MKKASIIVFIFSVLFFATSSSLSAWDTNMSATVVLGQLDFSTATTTPVTASSLNSPVGTFTDGTRLIISDNSNNRVLIWNTIPTVNGTPADVVLGQPNLTSNTGNNGGLSDKSLSRPQGVFFDGTKLYVADRNNNRILIWNTLPTTNFQAANVVVGQPDFTTNTAAVTASKLGSPRSVLVHNNKLIISDNSASRVLIYNTVPTTNGASANVVVGQADFTSTGGATANNRLSGPNGISVSDNRLYVADTNNSRIMIWNTLPTSNGAAADVVLGQPNFTSSTADTGGISCASLNLTDAVSVIDNGTRLAVGDASRVLIFNTLPTTNNQTADIVLGQPDCSTRTANNGGISSSSLSGNARPGISTVNNRLLVADNSNARVLIFDNLVPTPAPGAQNNSSSSSSSSSGSNTTSTPSCTDQAPATAPDLFQINISKDKATLYFAPPSNPYDKIFVSYGLTPSAEQFGVEFSQQQASGSLYYTIHELSPNVTYYFKVRGGNGCASGPWSKVLKVKTDTKYSKGGFIYYAYNEMVLKVNTILGLLK